MTRTAVICARVSTTAQAERGHSISTQLAAMRLYAERDGMTVVDEIRDEVSGAIPIQERPGGAKLYEHIDSRDVDAVVFFTIDRITRDEDLIEINVIRRDIRNAGMELHYANDGGKADLSTWGGVIDTLKAAGAAEERKKIAERTKRNIIAKVESGKVAGVGRAPYGYSFNKKAGSLEIVDEHAEIVREIFDLYTVQRLSIGAIARKLNEASIPSPRGSKWQTFTIRSILINETYAGTWHYRKVITAGHRKVADRVKNEQIAVSVPAIIDRETFEMAQGQREQNKALNPRRSKREYLLRGMFKCSKCGSAMVGVTTEANGKEYSYYQCRGKVGAERGGTRCRMTKFDKDSVESWSWGVVAEICTSSEIISQELHSARERSLQQHDTTIQEIAEIDRKLASLKQQANNVAVQMRLAKAGSVAAASLSDQLSAISDQHEKLTKSKSKLEAEIAKATISEEEITETIEWADEMAMMFLTAEDDQRRAFMLDHEVEVVAIGKNEISVSVVVGGERIAKPANVRKRSIKELVSELGSQRNTSRPTRSKCQTRQRPT